jgi:hypothetical protein
MRFTQGEHLPARTCVTRALAIDATDRDVSVLGGHLFGHIEQAAGNMSAASDQFASSLEGFRQLDIPWGIGNALIGKASVSLATGAVEHGEQLLDDATSVLRHAGPWFLNQPLYVRAILSVRRGKADEAIAFVRQSLESSRRLHDRFGLIYALTPLAAAAVLKGDHTWAARILGTRDAVTERIGITTVDRSVLELRERVQRDVSELLGPDRWARAHAAGRSASIDALLKDIDSKRRVGH